MPLFIDSIFRHLAAATAVAGLMALSACGGGDVADAAAGSTTTTVASADTTSAAPADHGAGEVASDQMPSILSTAAGLPSEHDVQPPQSL